MNPFDLPGPQFLLFYLVFGVLVAWLMVVMRRRADDAVGYGGRTGLLTDYLDIAFLRGGENEALRVAALTLVRRGMLEVVNDDQLRTKDRSSIRLAQKETERQVLEKFTEPRPAASLFADKSLREIVTAACEPTLVRLGLMPDPDTKARRRSAYYWAALMLASVGIAKIVVALSRGRTNIVFLIILMLLFLLVTYALANPTRTHAGDTMLGDLQKLFDGLKTRGWPRETRSDSDISLLAAVFGMGALDTAMPDARKLFPKAASSSDSSSSSSSGCGSSCGSSSDGGGGGGGCGGCGGGGGCGG